MKFDDLVFEWDEEKNRRNIAKHKVSFETARLVFNDSWRIEDNDLRHSDDEDRYWTIGMVGNILYVVYTERGKVIRLISARRATKREKGYYYDHKNDFI